MGKAPAFLYVWGEKEKLNIQVVRGLGIVGLAFEKEDKTIFFKCTLDAFLCDKMGI